MNKSASRWLPSNAERACQLRVLCFPHVGGGTAMFHRWARRLPDYLHVVPIKLPGREDRSREPAHDCVHALVEEMTADLADFLKAVPFALFGHSMGGLISYEWSQLLRAEQIQPVHVFVSACRAPTGFRPPDQPMHRLPDEEMITRLNARYGAGEAVHPDELTLMKLLAPTIRADLKLLETYEHRDHQPLTCPLTALGGAEDQQITRVVLDQWRPHTADLFTLRIFPGGHFYLRDQESNVTTFVSSRLPR